MAATAEELAARIEAYREEMLRMEKKLKELAENFLQLDDYGSAARCAIKAEGLKFIIGRIPPSN